MLKADLCRFGQHVSWLSCSVLVLAALSCAESTVPEGDAEEVSSLSQAVVGGETADACEWPSTVSVNAWGSCTGTLIHPRVVTTAAHCIEDGKSTIYFGANRSTPGAFSLEARCEVGAEGSKGANTSRDWAYCILPEDERVAKIPVTPPLVGCEADKYLKPGLEAWVVGFGTTSMLGSGAGTKRQVSVMINALNKAAQGTIDVGDAEQGACHGDSGGPLYVHLKDGEHDWGYRVVGSTSGAGARLCDCNCSTVYVNIANHIKAIEEKEHIDVTPCTDASGKFEASPACGALITTPQDGTGSFPACTVARTSEAINSCNGLLDSARPAAGSGGTTSGQGAAGRAADVLQPSAAGRAPDITSAVGVASMPAAAFEPVAASGAAGRPAIGSSTFGTTAAGGPAVEPPAAPAEHGGCSVVAAVGGHTSSVWVTAVSALGALSLLRARRRQRQSRSL